MKISTQSLPNMSARKSILKTPGTAKGKPKNVIFNEKLNTVVPKRVVWKRMKKKAANQNR